jgi:hypothetical protein
MLIVIVLRLCLSNIETYKCLCMNFYYNLQCSCEQVVRMYYFLVFVILAHVNDMFHICNWSGRDVKCPFAEELVYTIKERRYYDQIERAYNYASHLLLSLLMEEKELVARLKWDLLSCVHSNISLVFLLSQNDNVIVTF